MPELVEAVGGLRPQAKLPSLQLPLWLFQVFPVFDWWIAKLTGNERLLTLDAAKEFGGVYQNYDTTRLRTELGWKPRPLNVVLSDTLDWLDQMRA